MIKINPTDMQFNLNGSCFSYPPVWENLLNKLTLIVSAFNKDLKCNQDKSKDSRNKHKYMRYEDREVVSSSALETSCIMSNRCSVAIEAEVEKRGNFETSGILLGFCEGNNWYIIESIDPGWRATVSNCSATYDDDYVEHLSNVYSRIYKKELEVIGLWHKHPGSMDYFSLGDERINKKLTIADNGKHKGAIHMLVNKDPLLRYTMYYVEYDQITDRCNHSKIKLEINDLLIPEKYNDLKDARATTCLNNMSCDHNKKGQSVDKGLMEQHDLFLEILNNDLSELKAEGVNVDEVHVDTEKNHIIISFKTNESVSIIFCISNKGNEDWEVYTEMASIKKYYPGLLKKIYEASHKSMHFTNDSFIKTEGGAHHDPRDEEKEDNIHASGNS